MTSYDQIFFPNSSFNSDLELIRFPTNEFKPRVEVPVDPPKEFPDGGAQAWWTVAGSSACLFVSFGWVNCVGIFQDYYQANQLSQYSPSEIAWIPSLQLFFMVFMGLIVGKILDDHGPAIPLLFGTFLHVIGLILTSLSSTYAQILLSQAVLSAIGASMVFYPAFNCVSTWFMKKRGMAIGLVVMGSSVGGVIFPIMLIHLIPTIGFAWAIRTCAFLILALLIFANSTVRSRVDPVKRPFVLTAFFTPLREIPFTLTTAAIFFFYWGMFLPLTYIVVEAVAQGMPLTLANYLVPILNGASIIGRTVPNALADKVGHFNMMILMSAFTTILILGVWLPISGQAASIAFAVFYGISSGAGIGLAPVLIHQISEVQDMGNDTINHYEMARNVGDGDRYVFKDWLSTQEQTIPLLADIEQLTDRVVRFMGGNPGEMQLQGTNTYLIGTGHSRILIDTGEANHDIDLAHILLTHWHGDHTGGVPDLIAYDPSLAGRVHKHTPDPGQRPIGDGEIFTVQGATLRALFTPGHAIDHMCFILEEENALFTGDNVLGHGYSVEEDLGEYMHSLSRMYQVGCAKGYPAHGGNIENLPHKIDQYIRRKQVRERLVIQELKDAKQRRGHGQDGFTVKELAQKLHGDLSSSILEGGLEPSIAQVLKKLAEDRRVGFTNVRGRRRWFLNERATGTKEIAIVGA
ncbi:hypothetical protein DL768_004485 [Monosporascus sp. mg162]|nr:hypothetical protein DL768_004485 [Monosporascus sp. mg162]